MDGKRFGMMWRAFLIGFVSACLVSISGQPIGAKGEEESYSSPKTNVFVYPKKLTDKDRLVDGPSQRVMNIKSETTLIWVDLAPDYRFAHPTEYVLISTQGTRVYKGQWWPVLNGKALFRDGKSYKADFPVKLTGN